MKPAEIIQHESPAELLAQVLCRVHTEGPVELEDLETLTLLKIYHSEVFSVEESKLMYLLGLFYKTTEPNDILSFSYSIFRESIFDEAGHVLSPVQASMRNHILNNRYFSFSAPTSAGKSYLLRELIRDVDGDMVIVVPSRALISEYLLAVRDIVSDRKDILVLQFIDDVNRKNTSRRIFIVTPERGTELFKSPSSYDVKFFLYDEAQISEEKVRGISFDSFVRRSDKAYPDASKVFAHPFINNPEAQLSKHGFRSSSQAHAYRQSTVGKAYIGYNASNESFEYFSPFIADAHYKKNKFPIGDNIVANCLQQGGTVLIYVSKASILDRSFESKFSRYIDLCQEVTDPQALSIIDEVERMIGAEGKGSNLVSLMKRGVVIHHGSIPLSVRFLIERFTNAEYARICFSTSTLAQGVNMPFDIVWVHNVLFQGSKEDRSLGLKNLIGRAGRSSNEVNCFDYGHVVVSNIKPFVEKLIEPSFIKDTSVLDQGLSGLPDDLTELVEAIINENIDDEYDLPISRTNRLASEEAQRYIVMSLELLFSEGKLITGNSYRSLPEEARTTIKNSLKGIFELSIGRPLSSGEKSVLSASITILLWHIQGKTFKELLALRYGYLTRQREQRELRRKLQSEEITHADYESGIAELRIGYSPIPYSLPNSTLKVNPPSTFRNQSMFNFNYDLLVYDTYDYLDKVLSFSLSHVFVAAYGQYYERTLDERANSMVNYIRYGTNETNEIWLLRYGFTFEEIERIIEYVISINEEEIVFSDNIHELNDDPIMSRVERYL